MKKVLYAENDINLALAVKSLLETQYMQVQHESRGRDVLENFASFNPDLLILDVMLDDDKDGFQVAEDIRKKSQVPILFISSNDESSHLRRAFNIKHTDYIRKPFTIQELQLRINRILYQGNLIQTPENHFVLLLFPMCNCICLKVHQESYQILPFPFQLSHLREALQGACQHCLY